MTDSPQNLLRLVDKLQQFLPLPATPTPALRAYLRRAVPGAPMTSRWQVTSVFYAGEAGGLLCQLVVQEATATPRIIMAPLTQIAFDRRHSIAREIAANLKRPLSLRP